MVYFSNKRYKSYKRIGWGKKLLYFFYGTMVLLPRISAGIKHDKTISLNADRCRVACYIPSRRKEKKRIL